MELCGYKFRTEALMKKHMEKHLLNLQFQCSVCSKNFLRKNALSMHIKKHLL
jgi:hypothetical protein